MTCSYTCRLAPVWFMLGVLLAIAPPRMAAAQPATLAGTVATLDGEALPFASVAVEGTTYGAAAALDGAYRLTGVPPGRYVLMAAAVGFRARSHVVDVAAGDTVRVDFALEPAVVEMDGLTVTGTLVETFVRESPVRVNVIAPQYLEKIPTANVMEVLENVNGLYQQIDCAVCGTNNIRINGMDGPYTAVLIDGMPIMSRLATVYGLNGISPSLIQQVEVIKGPMSTLYGSEAMGGVINIITKRPETAPRLAVNSFGTSDGEYAVDVGVVPSRGRLATLLSGTFFYNDRFLDENGDAFADLTLNRRVSLFGKAALSDRSGFRRTELSARYYTEDRVGGTRAFVEQFADSLRGSGRLYGETIRTDRVELTGGFHLVPEAGLRLDVAYNDHRQDSYYGADGYRAEQRTRFAQLVWPLAPHRNHALLLGSAVRYEYYDDNTGATGEFDAAGRQTANRVDRRLVPGLFAQHEWYLPAGARLLTGLRLDHQRDHGLIPSPRLSLKLAPAPTTTLRVNAGTGFRIVNLFTEDHAAYSGARATLVMEALAPERSVNGTLSIQQIVPFGGSPLTIDLEGFYTYFTNKIEPDYSEPGIIRYANLDGSAATRGVSLTVGQQFFALPLSYTLGATAMEVFRDQDGRRTPLEFAPAYQGVANVTYRLERAGLALDYTANLTGPMPLPAFAPPFERPTRSPAFSIHNVQLTRDFEVSGGVLQAYVAVENLFDYTQPAPLIDPENPFGEHFDTSYVYGPIHGRCTGAGLRLIVR